MDKYKAAERLGQLIKQNTEMFEELNRIAAAHGLAANRLIEAHMLTRELNKFISTVAVPTVLNS